MQPSAARSTTIPMAHAAAPRTGKPRLALVSNTCSGCKLRDVCLPAGLEHDEAGLLDSLDYTRMRVKRGEALLRAGSPFESIYAVRTGFLKSSVVLDDGRDQVTGFHMAGEIVGLDGIGSGHHMADVTALEDGEVCIIPYAKLESHAGLQRQLHRVMSQELVRDQGVMMLLGTMRAEERVATFLLNLSQRLVARGFSACEFHLRMKREEIGSYLGLSLETVSRIFSRFQEQGLVSVQQKHIRILDVPGLRAVMGVPNDD